MKSISIIFFLTFYSLINFGQNYFWIKVKLIDYDTKQRITNIDSVIVIDKNSTRKTVYKKEIKLKDEIFCFVNLPINKEYQYIFFCPDYRYNGNYYTTTNNDKFFNTLELNKKCNVKLDYENIDLKNINCYFDGNFDKKLIINSKDIITAISLSILVDQTNPMLSKFKIRYSDKYRKDKLIESTNPIYKEFERIIGNKKIFDKDCKYQCTYRIDIHFSL